MTEAIKPSRSLLTRAGRAIGDYDMIRHGDRVLLGLSGGKDSLSLLHVLLELKKKAPIRFDLAAATIDPQTPEYDPSPLKTYVPRLGIPYFFESFPIVEQAKQSMQGDSFCAFCSRLRRGLLYVAVRGGKVTTCSPWPSIWMTSRRPSSCPPFSEESCGPCRPTT
jgi:tRNA 2-thiocytidine biosynthesis protein TtcA